MRKYGEVLHYKAPEGMEFQGELWVMVVTEKDAMLIAAIVPSGAVRNWTTDIGRVTTWTWENFHTVATCYFTCNS